MSLDTYANLQTSIGTWLARDDLTSFIPDLITLGEDRLFSELRVREMETAFSGMIAGGVVAVPDDYLEFAFVYVDGSPVQTLRRMDLEALYAEYPTRSSYGKPTAITRNASNFEFGPFPDSAYTINGTYYAKPTALSDSSTTNTVFPTYPSLYLFAALCEAEPFLGDDSRVQLWEGKYQACLDRANKQKRREAYSGSRIQPRAG